MAKTSKPGNKVKSQVNKAGKKKAALTATKKSTPPNQVPSGSASNLAVVRDFEVGDTQSYLGLRQSLDSFQARALYYYSSGADTQERIDRAEQIKNHLRSFMRQASVYPFPDSDCPPGTRACPSGDCIPVHVGCVP